VGVHPGSRQAPAGAMQPADVNQQPPHTPAAGLQVKPTSKPQPPADRVLIRPSSGVTAKLRGEVGFLLLACLPDRQFHNARTLVHGVDGMLVEAWQKDLQQSCRSVVDGPMLMMQHTDVPTGARSSGAGHQQCPQRGGAAAAHRISSTRGSADSTSAGAARGGPQCSTATSDGASGSGACHFEVWRCLLVWPCSSSRASSSKCKLDAKPHSQHEPCMGADTGCGIARI
jgi:hypothetical protein